MKHGLLYIFIFSLLTFPAMALEVFHRLETTIGYFDVSRETFTYKFYNNHDYDIKTTVATTGTFGTIYPFNASYHAVGIFDKQSFRPQSYFLTAQSRFHKRSKEIVYQNGIPQYRISQKDEKRRQDTIETDAQYPSSNDLLSTFAELSWQIVQKDNCDFERYSFNGKRYSRSKVKTLTKEKIETPYFSGKALKCEYKLEILDDADAGFMLKSDTPVHFWILKDKSTGVPFIARILVESTPFGQMETLTTQIEVKK